MYCHLGEVMAAPCCKGAASAYSRFMSSLVVRSAHPDDATVIHRLITELAVYEKEPDAVEVTPSILAEQMRQTPPPFEAIVAEDNGEVLGFALFFPTYSTWKGKAGLWLEDFYVTPAARGRGVGDAMFAWLGQLCVERGYARFELTALDWNELALRFYRKRGAVPMDEWTTWRISGQTLEALGDAP